MGKWTQKCSVEQQGQNMDVLDVSGASRLHITGVKRPLNVLTLMDFSCNWCQVNKMPVNEVFQSLVGTFTIMELKRCPIPGGIKEVTVFLSCPCFPEPRVAHVVSSEVVLWQWQEGDIGWLWGVLFHSVGRGALAVCCMMHCVCEKGQLIHMGKCKCHCSAEVNTVH